MMGRMPAADWKKWAIDRLNWIQDTVKLALENLLSRSGRGSTMPEFKKVALPTKIANEAKVASVTVTEGTARGTMARCSHPRGQKGGHVLFCWITGV
jgi:hypothetical protein